MHVFVSKRRVSLGAAGAFISARRMDLESYASVTSPKVQEVLGRCVAVLGSDTSYLVIEAYHLS